MYVKMYLNNYNKIEDVGFTLYNFLLLIICYLYNFELYNLYSICCCNSWGILTSFHCIIFFDENAFNKMALKLKINMPIFHFGNCLLHILPCYISYINKPQYIKLYHGIISAFLHLFWIYIISHKSWSLNNVYIEEPQRVWNKLYIICSVTEILVPYIIV